MAWREHQNTGIWNQHLSQQSVDGVCGVSDIAVDEVHNEYFNFLLKFKLDPAYVQEIVRRRFLLADRLLDIQRVDEGHKLLIERGELRRERGVEMNHSVEEEVL